MKTKKISLLLAVSMLTSFIFTGCSSEPEHGLSVTMIAPYADTDKAEEYEATLSVGAENLPVMINAEMMTATTSTEEAETTDTTDEESYEDSLDNINQNSAEMMGAVGMMTITAQVAGQEIDIIISDYDNAQTLSNNGAFMPLEDVFTAEELAEIDESLHVSYAEVDNDNTATGNMLAPSGIDVSDIEEFSEILYADQLVLHVVGNTENMDAVKEYISTLL